MELKKLEEVEYHPTQEILLHILRTKVQNLESDLYFRVLAAFHLSQMASNMRVIIETPHRGKLPVNQFVLGLMESGGGKGHSINILEDSVFKEFKNVFMKHTFPQVAEQNIATEARRKAVINQTDEQTELDELNKEYISYGNMVYSFDSGTGPAYKQIRTKAQIAGVGALSMICDEIGTNLLGNSELFSVNLEAYDVGKIKQKIIKNSSDNKRGEERDSPVPSNMLIFGTPSKLFNGGMEEREFYSLLETGYARRLLYGIGQKSVSATLSAEEMFDILTSHTDDSTMDGLNAKFGNLADSVNYQKTIYLTKPVALINLQYQLNCDAAAAELSPFEAIRKAEMQHRYFKALKLAGAYAFVDGSLDITEDQMYAAIKLVEDSGKAFEQILSRDKPYAKLAKYISGQKGKSLTHADLSEDLPFYPIAKGQREDMMQLAIAWGYRNNVIIKKSFDNGIEFYDGETLKETNLNEIMLSYANHEAYGYVTSKVPFDKLNKLFLLNGYHWCNHSFLDNHRKEDNVIPEFNCVVIDVDGGIQLNTAKELLSEFTACYYTTKRSTPDSNRFRIIIPMKYHLKMQAKEFKEFMHNIFDWLPFDSDKETAQRSKKWLCNSNGNCETNVGELFDPTMFIPQTSKNEVHKKQIQDMSNMDRIESWFARGAVDGNRSNTMIKFALMLLDSGLPPDEVESAVFSFNDKWKNKLGKDELESTVLKTMWSRAAVESK